MKKLWVLFVVVLMTLCLAGCGGGGSKAPDTKAADGGTIKVGPSTILPAPSLPLTPLH